MKKFSHKLTALLLAASLAVPAQALTITADNDNTRTYNGQFTDVSESDWFYDNVVEAYSLGLINGKTDTTFAPSQTLTIAETIKLAALSHQILTSGSVDETAFEAANSSHWYDGYLAYCTQNGIVTEEYNNYNAAASRAQVAVLFSRALISSGTELEEINLVAFGDLPDVDVTMWYSSAVYRLVRWGILSGDANGNINPESNVKRSEISAILMRVIDKDERVVLGEVKDSAAEENSTAESADPPSPEAPSAGTEQTISDASLTLYEGDFEEKTFTGVTGFAGEFTISDGISYVNAEYSLDLVNSLTLESDSISFSLYTGSGYEALGIVRGWLNESARGKNGAAVREKDDVYDAINELCSIFADGERKTISEMWYADHGEYTTYAFYFDKPLDPAKISSVSLAIGQLDKDLLISASMSDLAERIENSENEVITPDVSEPVSDNYSAAISDAKESAAEVIFEYECERCDILYGRGFYGRESDEYRLLFIFRDGTVQTVASSKLDDIRMNTAGNVLYYNMTAPDGKVLQYGINFGE